MPVIRLVAFRYTDHAALEAMADPSEKSLLSSPHQHRTAANPGEWLDSLSSLKLVGEPLAPLWHDWKTEAHAKAVKDESGLAVA